MIPQGTVTALEKGRKLNREGKKLNIPFFYSNPKHFPQGKKFDFEQHRLWQELKHQITEELRSKCSYMQPTGLN